jgi:hypothetical protein
MARLRHNLPNTLVAMAISLVGDADFVRREIGCSPANFTAYCAAQQQPPWPEHDRLIQLIVREQQKVIARNRDLISQIRAKTQNAEAV